MKGYFTYDAYWARILGLALFSVRLLHDPQQLKYFQGSKYLNAIVHRYDNAIAISIKVKS
ncbi:MAG: hypothetical protein ACK6CP_10270 [Pseudanabaena sp.]